MRRNADRIKVQQMLAIHLCGRCGMGFRKQEMPVNVRIITEDRRVTERIFEQFANLEKR